MDLDDFIMTVFCRIDDLLPQVTGGQRVRERGPQATLADSEVLTMEVVGEYLGLGQEQALFAYFRRHYAHFFPALRRLHRTTVERQAANLWALKERLWLRLLLQTPHDPTLGLLDSFPVPVCGFARAPRCRRFHPSPWGAIDHHPVPRPGGSHPKREAAARRGGGTFIQSSVRAPHHPLPRRAPRSPVSPFWTVLPAAATPVGTCRCSALAPVLS